MGSDRKVRLKSYLSMASAALLSVLANINAIESKASELSPKQELLQQIYLQEDYPAARQLAEEILATQPNNLIVRYYLANCLLKLKLPREALVEYRTCYIQGKGTAVARQSALALAAFSTAGFKKELPDSRGTGGKKSRLESLKEDLLQKELEEKKSLRRAFDTTINNIQKSSTIKSQAERDQQTQAAFDKLAVEEAQIERRYQKQLESLLHRDSQIVSGTSFNNGNGRVNPQGSSIYVQNFEHLGDESEAVTIPAENPLEAKALSLVKPTGQTTQPPPRPSKTAAKSTKASHHQPQTSKKNK